MKTVEDVVEIIAVKFALQNITEQPLTKDFIKQQIVSLFEEMRVEILKNKTKIGKLYMIPVPFVLFLLRQMEGNVKTTTPILSEDAEIERERLQDTLEMKGE